MASMPAPATQDSFFDQNLERYQSLCEELNLEPDEQRDMLYALYQMMEAIVDLAFGTHPTQLALEETCGQFEGSRMVQEPSMISSMDASQFREDFHRRRKDGVDG